MVEITTLPVTEFQQNCRILTDEVSSDCLIVDPGGDIPEVLEFLKRHKLKPIAILLTHGHVDHAGGTARLRKHFEKIPIYAHKGDEFLLTHLKEHGAMFGAQCDSLNQVDHWLTANETLKLLNVSIKVLHTPGHSPGSCCFYFDNGGAPTVIVGDVLFAGSIGRTDLWGGDHATLISSIRTKLLSLPDETQVLSGHGPDSTIGEERASNPFLK